MLFQDVNILLIYLGVLDMILFILFIISTLKCLSNFGKGLKAIMFKNKLKLNEISSDSPDFKDIQYTDL